MARAEVPDRGWGEGGGSKNFFGLGGALLNSLVHSECVEYTQVGG